MFIDNHSSFGVCWPRAHKCPLMLSANKKAATSINYVWAVDGTLTYHNWNSMWSYSYFKRKWAQVDIILGFDVPINENLDQLNWIESSAVCYIIAGRLLPLDFLRNSQFWGETNRGSERRISINVKYPFQGFLDFMGIEWRFNACLIVQEDQESRENREAHSRAQLRMLFLFNELLQWRAHAKMNSIKKCKWNVVWLLRWIMTSIISLISKSLINQNCQVSHFKFLGVVNIYLQHSWRDVAVALRTSFIRVKSISVNDKYINYSLSPKMLTNVIRPQTHCLFIFVISFEWLRIQHVCLVYGLFSIHCRGYRYVIPPVDVLIVFNRT